MNLKELTREIPYKWREGPGGRQLAYIDARDVMDLLDEVVGPENWQCDYRDVAGKVYCGIGIRDTDNGWVWKWDVGTETDFESDKGEASDAFKRAAVKWGVGRFLYSLEDEKPTTQKKLENMGVSLGKCPKCGAPMKLSKQGKTYCSDLCWKQ